MGVLTSQAGRPCTGARPCAAPVRLRGGEQRGRTPSTRVHRPTCTLSSPSKSSILTTAIVNMYSSVQTDHSRFDEICQKKESIFANSVTPSAVDARHATHSRSPAKIVFTVKPHRTVYDAWCKNPIKPRIETELTRSYKRRPNPTHHPPLPNNEMGGTGHTLTCTQAPELGRLARVRVALAHDADARTKRRAGRGRAAGERC